MKRIQAVALAVLLAACGTMPQNPEDFRKAVSGGAMMTNAAGRAGDALVLDLPTAPTRSLDAYKITRDGSGA